MVSIYWKPAVITPKRADARPVESVPQARVVSGAGVLDHYRAKYAAVVRATWAADRGAAAAKFNFLITQARRDLELRATAPHGGP